jgi:hypothetical protein
MSSVPMFASLNVSVSADSARLTVDVGRRAARRIVDPESKLLLECIAAAYRSYHQADAKWTQTRPGERRLRLVGKFGTEAVPRGSYISVDLDDFQ